MDNAKVITNIKRLISTAEHHLRTADREYAYAKNFKKNEEEAASRGENNRKGTPYAYKNSQEEYAKARESLQRAKDLVSTHNVADDTIKDRIRDIDNRIRK